MVPPGALIKFVQKGLQYMEMEANLSNSEVDIDEDFSFFQPLDLISKDVKELQDMLREKKRKERDMEKERDRSKENDKGVEREHEGDRNRAKEKDRHEKQKEREREREKLEREKEREREKIEREKEREREKMEREIFEREKDRLKLEKEREIEREREREKIEREKSHEKQLGDADREMVIDQTDKEIAGDGSTGAEPMDIVMTPTSQTSHIPNSDVRILEGHTSEVLY
jgi:transducin (beta)-like 1